MSERQYILSKLDDIGKETFIATEHWGIEEWRVLRDREYYQVRDKVGGESKEFRLYKLKKILKK
tara:strand:- start:844 stop:1035 length:192 start_codon:yes stop_codon:yes gene_type:complete